MSKSKKKEIVDLGHMLAGIEEGKILSGVPKEVAVKQSVIKRIRKRKEEMPKSSFPKEVKTYSELWTEGNKLIAKSLRLFREFEGSVWFPEEYVKKLEATMKQWKAYHLEKVGKLEADLKKEKSFVAIYSQKTEKLLKELATAKQEAEKWKDLNELAEKRSADLFKRIWEAQKILTQWGGTRFAESLVEKLRKVLEGEKNVV